MCAEKREEEVGVVGIDWTDSRPAPVRTRVMPELFGGPRRPRRGRPKVQGLWTNAYSQTSRTVGLQFDFALTRGATQADRAGSSRPPAGRPWTVVVELPTLGSRQRMTIDSAFQAPACPRSGNIWRRSRSFHSCASVVYRTATKKKGLALWNRFPTTSGRNPPKPRHEARSLYRRSVGDSVLATTYLTS